MEHYKKTLLSVLAKLAATSKNKAVSERLIAQAKELKHLMFLEEVIGHNLEGEPLSYSFIKNNKLFLSNEDGTHKEIEL